MNEMLRVLLALPPQASTVARELDTLHYVVITISVLGAVGITVAVALFLVRYGHSVEQGKAERALGGRRAHVPFALEIIVVAGLLGLFVLFGVIGFRQYVHLRRTPPDAMPIYVVGKQWMWSFAYPDGTATNGDLYVPVGQPVELLMTSRDVIHSFFVPAFRVKHDVVPGRMTRMWFEVERPGVYDAYCTEYCGLSHSRMRARVIALPPDEFAAWSERRADVVDLAARGQRVAAEAGCFRCHTVDGTPHLGPTFAGLYGSRVPLAGGGSVVVDEAYITESMMEPARRLHEGFAPIMPSYMGVLPAPDTAAIVEYVRSLGEGTPP
ncbi:MAG: cytochrome c oxidase subunit II [Deltaproteobacteria bacterium]|nr:cytochrome c oxidase subunit II [Kofleriaceae bacterium]